MCPHLKEGMPNDLDIAKQKLLDKLGPNHGDYIRLLGKWFRGIISKEEFDRSAKHLIDQNFIIEHNKFWLAFFHHCANNLSVQNTSAYRSTNSLGTHLDHITSSQANQTTDKVPSQTILNDTTKVRCLPNKVITHMKIFVIAWEMGLDSANDQVSTYINLALQHFLKNMITELISTKTAYRLRENRFKYAMGVKPINPYLNNSLRVYTNSLEYDPYQIESNKMNSSILDTCIYNDSLFPSRLYEAQALYEYACSTASISKRNESNKSKRLKLSDLLFSSDEETNDPSMNFEPLTQVKIDDGDPEGLSEKNTDRTSNLHHLLVAFLINKSIVPSHSLYSMNLEKIFTKLSRK